MEGKNTFPNDTKKLFRKHGTCSQTLFFILNREFGNDTPLEYKAAEPFAGGINQMGYQCGMLWGASLALGTEAFKRINNQGKATSLSIKSTQDILQSFLNKAGFIDCEDITEYDMTKKLNIAKFMITGKFLACFNLMDEWVPDAITVSRKSLNVDPETLPEDTISCASNVVKKMGGSDKQCIMVAGFAGGLGLSGNVCGALCAAILMKNIQAIINNEKMGFKNKYAEMATEALYEISGYELLCNKISGKNFESIESHTEFIKCGGCEEVIDKLSNI